MKTPAHSCNPHLFIRLLALLIALTLSGVAAALAAGRLSLGLGRATGGGQALLGGGYTLAGAAGQAEAGRLDGDGLRLNGGVIGEILPPTPPPSRQPQAYLPLTWLSYPTWLRLAESEPNNLFSQANPVPALPALVSGAHDGPAGGGDVYALSLEAGEWLEAALDSGDPAGVQLLAYDPDGLEVGRAYAAPFRLAIRPASPGLYYVYVFSAPETGNLASYSLRLQAEHAPGAPAGLTGQPVPPGEPQP